MNAWGTTLVISASGRVFMNRDKSSLLGLTLTGAGLYLAARAIRQYARWYDLNGKTALITGGSRGLGLALGRELVASGAGVGGCGRDVGEVVRCGWESVGEGHR